jgi:sugar/nucleoside kinase (ribokinase family)
MTNEKDPRKAAVILTEKDAKMVIITMGEKGLIARTDEITLEMPAFKVQVTDPSGAPSRPSGISKLSVEDICEVLIEGAAAGAACVTGVGTTAAVSRENIDRLLKWQGREIRRNTKITSN